MKHLWVIAHKSRILSLVKVFNSRIASKNEKIISPSNLFLRRQAKCIKFALTLQYYTAKHSLLCFTLLHFAFTLHYSMQYYLYFALLCTLVCFTLHPLCFTLLFLCIIVSNVGFPLLLLCYQFAQKSAILTYFNLILLISL